MDGFRNRLKKRILMYLGINILLSFIVLIISFPFVSKSTGTEAYGFTMLAFVFHLVFLIVFWSISLMSLTVIPGSEKKSKFSIAIPYLFLPLIWM